MSDLLKWTFDYVRPLEGCLYCFNRETGQAYYKLKRAKKDVCVADCKVSCIINLDRVITITPTKDGKYIVHLKKLDGEKK